MQDELKSPAEWATQSNNMLHWYRVLRTLFEHENTRAQYYILTMTFADQLKSPTLLVDQLMYTYAILFIVFKL